MLKRVAYLIKVCPYTCTRAHTHDYVFVCMEWIQRKMVLPAIQWYIHVCMCVCMWCYITSHRSLYTSENKTGQKGKLLFWIIYYFHFSFMLFFISTSLYACVCVFECRFKCMCSMSVTQQYKKNCHLSDIVLCVCMRVALCGNCVCVSQ